MTLQNDDHWLLPLEGLISGVLTCMASIAFFSVDLSYLTAILQLPVALIFGAVIATHVRLFREVRSRSHLIGFIATCPVAFLVAVTATWWTPFHPEFLNFSGTGPGIADSSVYFSGGLLGSAIVCAAILFFLIPPRSLTLRQLAGFLLKAFGISLACGGLGVFGWSVGERAGLFIVWQTGAASLMGFLLPPKSKPAGPEPAEWSGLLELNVGQTAQSAAAAALLVATFATLIGLGTIEDHLALRHLVAAERQLAADRPSPDHLPAIAAPPIGQVLLLKDISGYPPGPAAGPRFLSRSDWGWVKDVSYYVTYKRSATAGKYEAPFAGVLVDIYPNSAWAVYSTKQIMRAAIDPKAVKTVDILGNRVISEVSERDPPLDFYWASGSRFVDVSFWAAEDDEFLKEYLARYPSTL